MTSTLAPRNMTTSGQFEDDEPPTFREVMAYLDGVAAAMTATRGPQRPVAIAACADAAGPTPAPCRSSASVPRPSGNESTCDVPGGPIAIGNEGHLTLLYGESSMAIDRLRPPSAETAMARSAAPRSGARVIDLGAADGSSQIGIPSRRTLPYGIATLSLAPKYTPAIAWVAPSIDLTPTISMLDDTAEHDDVRTSDVYLRCARLSPEWYDLTGTEEE